LIEGFNVFNIKIRNLSDETNPNWEKTNWVVITDNNR
jgi:hypothetical protein